MPYVIETMHSTKEPEFKVGDIVFMPSEGNNAIHYEILSCIDNSDKIFPQGNTKSIICSAKCISTNVIIEEPAYMFRLVSTYQESKK